MEDKTELTSKIAELTERIVTLERDMERQRAENLRELRALKLSVNDLNRAAYGGEAKAAPKAEPSGWTGQGTEPAPFTPEPKPAPAQSPAPVPAPNEQKEAPKRLSEVNLGKYGVGILAGLLVLLALGVGIRNYWAAIPAIVKLVLIIALGAGIELTGWLRLYKTDRQNGFWASVTGTGAAIVFVAIVAGNMAWELYGLVVTGVLMLLWFAVSFYLSMKANSLVFYSITYLGGVMSVVLAALQLAASREANPMGEAGMLIIVAVIAAIGLVNERRHRVLPFFGYAFAIVAFFALDVWYPGAVGILRWARPAVGALILFESLRLFTERKTYARVLTVIFSLAASGLLLVAAVGMPFNFEIESPYSLEAMARTGTAVLLALAALFAARRKPEEGLLALTPLIIGGLIFLSSELTKTVLIPAVLILAAVAIPRLRRDVWVRSSTAVAFVITAFFHVVFFFAFPKSDTGYVIAASAVMAAAPLLDFVLITRIGGSKIPVSFRIFELWAFFAALVPLFSPREIVPISTIWLLVALTLALIAYRITIFDRLKEQNGDRSFARVLTVISIVIIHLIAIVVANAAGWSDWEEKSGIITVLIALAATGLYEAVRTKSVPMTIIYAILANFDIFFIAGLVSKSGAQLAVSVTGVVLAAAFIALGFVFRHRELRITGLIFMLVYVLKITFFDVPSIGGTELNILLLLGGGLVCFAISFAYNRLDKVYGERPGSEK